MTIDEASCEVLKYLDKIWSSLSTSGCCSSIFLVIPPLCKFLMVSTVLGHVWGQLFWIENPLTRLLGIKNPLSNFFEWSSMKVRQHEESDRSGVQPDMIDHFLAYRDSEGKPPTHLQVVDGATATM